jgi:hypothetical protein
MMNLPLDELLECIQMAWKILKKKEGKVFVLLTFSFCGG